MTVGTHSAESITLATLPSGVEIATTVHTYRGEAGPTLYVQAAQHGREINGTEVLRRFHDRLSPRALTGTVVAVPVANPLTFDRVSYTTPEVLDSVNPNMNRVWPGDPNGSLHQRMAARLWEYVEGADAVVDLHTGSPDVLPHVVFPDGDAESRALAKAYGTDLLLAEAADEDAPAEWHRRDFDGKLRVAASREGLPSITPELGQNKRIVEPVVERGVDGLFAACRHLGLLDDEYAGMRDGAVERVDERERREVIEHAHGCGEGAESGDERAESREGTTTERENRDPTVAYTHLGQVTADASGLFRPRCALELGQVVSSGSVVGTVYEPTTYEALHEAAIERDGILYAITREATVRAGDRLAGVAAPIDE